MKRVELIKAVANESGQTQGTVKSVLDAMENVILANAKAGEDTHTGLLTVAIVQQPERKTRNPKTGETKVTPPGPIVRVKASLPLKRAGKGR